MILLDSDCNDGMVQQPPTQTPRECFSFISECVNSTASTVSHIKLASQLSGYEIDVYRESNEDDEDVNLEEFADEIESWVLDELKAIGCDTAKSVLNLSVEDLVKRTDLEEETITELVNVLKAEFE